MAAYVISEVEILDEEAAARYRPLAARSIELYGGRYLVRGAVPEVVEGERPPAQRLVIVEFPSPARAREWYGSPEYAEALAARGDGLRRRVTFVESPNP